MKPAYSRTIKFALISSLFLFFFFSAKAQNQGPPPTIKPGLEINRSVLISKISKSDSSMIFKQEKDINGLPNFIGTDDDKLTIQLVGKEDELISAKLTFAFSTNKEVIIKEINDMAYFAFIMGEQTGVDWLHEKVLSIDNDRVKPFTETHGFNFNRQAELKYNPQAEVFTLTFVEWGTTFN